MTPGTVVPVILALVLTLPATPARAEWFFDLYAGGARTENGRLELETAGASLRDPVDYSESFAASARLGYWLGFARWLGVAVDGSFFEPDDDITIIPISALLMLRFPLFQSDDIPGGVIQPYVAAGPGIFITRFKGRVPFIDERVDETTADPGLDARAGIAIQLASNLALFAEYRYTDVKPELDVTLGGLDIDAETRFRTHHLLGGLSFRF
jgi:hypothetical protein